MNKIGKMLRKIRLENGSVLVIKADSELAQSVESIAQGVDGMGLSNVLLIVTSDLENIRALPDEEMHKLGWVRFPIKNPTYTTLVTLDEVDDPQEKENDVEPESSDDSTPGE